MTSTQVINQPKICTLDDINEARRQEPIAAVKAALEIAWVTAARGGDVRALRIGDVKVVDQTTKVKFCIGKTASSQPYTVMTTPLSRETSIYIEQRSREAGGGWLFPKVEGEQLKIALRRAHPKLEQRSIRRGALQHLAQSGLSDEALLHYSQHRSLQTLKRYLDFGWLSGECDERAKGAEGLSLMEEGGPRGAQEKGAITEGEISD